jgi:hypothetical protein
LTPRRQRPVRAALAMVGFYSAGQSLPAGAGPGAGAGAGAGTLLEVGAKADLGT